MLNPNMPTQELLLHMGELTTNEILVARSAIKWANNVFEKNIISDAIKREAMLIPENTPWDEVN